MDPIIFSLYMRGLARTVAVASHCYSFDQVKSSPSELMMTYVRNKNQESSSLSETIGMSRVY